MSEWRVTIPGVPIPKARPRLMMDGRRQVAYTPKKTRHWEALVRTIVKRDVLWTPDPAGVLPFKEPVRVRFCFRLPMPKSWTKKRKAAMEGAPHSQKPDLDNLIKSVLDGMGSVYFRDDSMVAGLAGGKTWCKPEHAGVDVAISIEKDRRERDS